MKQFGLYLLSVGVLFVIQVAVLGLLSFTSIAPGLTEIFYLFYFLPGGIIAGILVTLVPENLLPTGGLFLAFLAGLVALIYALVLAAVLWAITFIVIRIRDRSLKN